MNGLFEAMTDWTKSYRDELIASMPDPVPTPKPDCEHCNGVGWREYDEPGHSPDCDGDCRYCPVPIPAYDMCSCMEVR